MFLKTAYIMVAAVLFLSTTSVVGQENVTDSAPRHDGTSSKETERIFDQILQTLPEELKGEIDSAAHVRTQKASEARDEYRRQVTEDGNRPSGDIDGALGDLPAEVQQRVEKAIQEMEGRQQLRQAEFREVKKGKK